MPLPIHTYVYLCIPKSAGTFSQVIRDPNEKALWQRQKKQQTANSAGKKKKKHTNCTKHKRRRIIKIEPPFLCLLSLALSLSTSSSLRCSLHAQSCSCFLNFITLSNPCSMYFIFITCFAFIALSLSLSFLSYGTDFCLFSHEEPSVVALAKTARSAAIVEVGKCF